MGVAELGIWISIKTILYLPKEVEENSQRTHVYARGNLLDYLDIKVNSVWYTVCIKNKTALELI